MSLAQSLQEVEAKTETENIPDLDYAASARKGQGAKAIAKAERRSKLPPGFWTLINRNSCLQKNILEFFGEELDNYVSPKGYCCCKYTEAVSGSALWQPKVVYTVRNVQ